jgi:ribokinase
MTDRGGRGRVHVLGSLNMDLTVAVTALPRPGETVLGDRLVTAPGGKGANQAAAAARLGGEVRMVGRVGDDPFGEQLRGALAADSVDVSGVVVDGSAPTGAALIVVERGGQNLIAVAPGANGRVDERDVDRLVDGVAPGDVVVLQLEVPLDAVRSAAARAGRRGSVVLLNAAPSQPLVGQPPPAADVLVVNEGESAALSGIAADGLAAAEAAAGRLGEIAATVVVTLGAAGSLVWRPKGVTRIEPRRVDAVDATAAGDAFVGATALGLASGWDVARAARLGSLAGAAAVTRAGARSSLPSRDDLRRLFGPELPI